MNNMSLRNKLTITVLVSVLFLLPSLSSAVLDLPVNATIRGNLVVTGSFSKGNGTFLIDHPLDPKNKLLYHSFVESPDVKNIYDGVVTLDEKGEVEITLPTYFEALNRDFRYQFFPLEGPSPNLYIKEGIKENRFTISGGTPGGKVSWQVTGIRHDPYIKKNPIITEVWKGSGQPVDFGEYIFEGYEDFLKEVE